MVFLPGTIPLVKDSGMQKTDQAPALMAITYILPGGRIETDNQQI